MCGRTSISVGCWVGFWKGLTECLSGVVVEEFECGLEVFAGLDGDVVGCVLALDAECESIVWCAGIHMIECNGEIYTINPRRW
jgi:hypothetical protein